MRIVQASLCLRFHRAEGWTRQKVAKLGVDPVHVSLRHFDTWLDEKLKEEQGNPNFDKPFVAYYAVHDPVEHDKLDISGHEVVPFNFL